MLVIKNEMNLSPLVIIIESLRVNIMQNQVAPTARSTFNVVRYTSFLWALCVTPSLELSRLNYCALELTKRTARQ